MNRQRVRLWGAGLALTGWASCGLAAQDATADGSAEAEAPPEAATPSPISDRLAIRLGYYAGDIASDGRIDVTGVVNSGTPFSGEQDFGLADRKAQLRGEFMFRIRQRARMIISGLDVSRRAEVNAAQDYVFGNEVLLTGERLLIRQDLNVSDFTWLYSPLRFDRFELGVGFGLHLLQTELEVRVPDRATGAVNENFSGSGPYPSLATDLTWRMTRRFTIAARAQLLQIKASDITATLGRYEANLQFRFKPHLAAGVGWHQYVIEVDAPNEDPGGIANFQFSGPELFLRASL